jgi:prevent-host-death family protein
VRTVTIRQARAYFLELIDSVKHGNEIVIAMDGKPVARLVPILPKRARRFGVLKGKVKIAKDFDASLSKECTGCRGPIYE